MGKINYTKIMMKNTLRIKVRFMLYFYLNSFVNFKFRGSMSSVESYHLIQDLLKPWMSILQSYMKENSSTIEGKNVSFFIPLKRIQRNEKS